MNFYCGYHYDYGNIYLSEVLQLRVSLAKEQRYYIELANEIKGIEEMDKWK